MRRLHGSNGLARAAGGDIRRPGPEEAIALSESPAMTNNALARFAGGPPAMVAVRLIVVSLVVGLVLETFGFDPSTLISDAVRSARAVMELGFTDIHEIGRILITGAMVVVPVWFALRLLESSRGR